MQSRITEMMAGHLEFNRKLLQEGIERGEFVPNDTEHLSYILEALFFGANQLSRSLSAEKTRTLHKEAVTVFLNGVVNK
mgnify:CR=1 FL=1